MSGGFVIRRAVAADARGVFDIANDPIVRANSINGAAIEWGSHLEWFGKKISSPDSVFCVAQSGEKISGYARLDRAGEVWAVSIASAAWARGRGLGAEMLSSLCAGNPEKELEAVVKLSNAPSLALFAGAGFERAGARAIGGENYAVFRRGKTAGKAKMEKVYIIAEMSANHCGDKNLAKRIIAAAKECGADAVKIQTYTADTITLDSRTPPFKISGGTLWDGKYLHDLYAAAYTPWEWQAELKEYADSLAVDFFSTPFDFSAVDFLESINVPRYKIASFEAMDYPLIEYAASKGKPMIVSTGVSSLEEIRGAVDACHNAGNRDITLLKCTSAYPAKPEDMNVSTISDMLARFSPLGVKVGLSDHSMGDAAALAADALGARVLEKHFTLDRNLGGADAAFSLEPAEFAGLVSRVRETEKVLGKPSYDFDEKNRRFARSLFAAKDIAKGEVFTPENVRSVRPSDGLHPKFYSEIIGRRAACDIPFAAPLKGEFVEGGL